MTELRVTTYNVGVNSTDFRDNVRLATRNLQRMLSWLTYRQPHVCCCQEVGGAETGYLTEPEVWLAEHLRDPWRQARLRTRVLCCLSTNPLALALPALLLRLAPRARRCLSAQQI